MKYIYSYCLCFQQQHIFVILVCLPWFPGQIQSKQTLKVHNLDSTVLIQKDHNSLEKSKVINENYISFNVIFREKMVPLSDQGLRTMTALFEETCYQNKTEMFHLQNQN